ncbi:hypothetical protein [Actinoplanes teichomyceticus]|uniref:Uncharacterized protein n=1 Tax=Actinoplanes teichomyceticus TaxID=1867 RepID=A0A561W9T7_ACTTI|nr:hypothetical protein [Actinoplanes teichomyceticus]TWG20620.1 hypothetical protein FHX34_103149 [Actinoplanes teichomyceticus]GIF15955.1 hypothetical protein Ate01nite_59870 [Actinoplanes teichomyceticus]
MPAQPFSVHPNPDDLARRDLAAALTRPSRSTDPDDQGGAADVTHHGRRDARQAARERSERAHAGRAARAAGRSYAFRRS